MELEFFPTITKEYILERVREEDIWSAYGCPVREGSFRSPPVLRTEDHASCHFYRTRNGSLRLIDFTGHFHGDWIDFVARTTGLSYGNLLLDVARKLNIINGKPVVSGTLSDKSTIIPYRPAAQIRVKRRKWNSDDKSYWLDKYGVCSKVLDRFGVSPAQRVWVNARQIYLYEAGNPAYIYHFGAYEYKIYFPYNQKGDKFRQTNGQILQGYGQLPRRGETLIVTKSLKDVIVLYTLGYSAVAPMSEGQILSEQHYLELSRRFERIISFYDFDYTGVCSMNRMKKAYKMQPIWVPPDYQAKDISDLVEKVGRKETQRLIIFTKSILK